MYQIIEKVKNELSNGDVRGALNSLKIYTNLDSKTNNQIIILLSRYHNWKSNQIIGVNENDIELRKIEQSILEILNKFENEILTDNNDNPQTNENKNSYNISFKESTLNNPILGSNNIVNITVKKQSTKKVVEKYPEGSIGRDVIMYGYAKHLADRYVEYKNYELKSKGQKFNYPMLYGKVKKDFKAGSFFHIPQTRFFELVEYLQTRIDRTVLAKINKSKGRIKNYSTFEEYQLENKIPPSV